LEWSNRGEVIQMFENIPILSILLALPFIGALIAFMLNSNPKMSKIVAMVFSAIPLALASLMMVDMVQQGYDFSTYSYHESYVWIEQLGISFTLGIDGISAPMVWLTTLSVFLAIVFSWDVEKRTASYMALMLILEVGVLGVFMALDYFLFYVFWEIVLIPMFFLIAIWGGPRRDYASIKFFIYTHVASLFMLLGIFALYFETAQVTGVYTFDMATIA